MLVQFAPIPFWNMVVNTSALLAKLNVSVTVALFLFCFFLSGLFNFVFLFLLFVCVSVCLCGGERLTDTALVGYFHGSL